MKNNINIKNQLMITDRFLTLVKHRRQGFSITSNILELFKNNISKCAFIIMALSVSSCNSSYCLSVSRSSNCTDLFLLLPFSIMFTEIMRSVKCSFFFFDTFSWLRKLFDYLWRNSESWSKVGSKFERRAIVWNIIQVPQINLPQALS